LYLPEARSASTIWRMKLLAVGRPGLFTREFYWLRANPLKVIGFRAGALRTMVRGARNGVDCLALT